MSQFFYNSLKRTDIHGRPVYLRGGSQSLPPVSARRLLPWTEWRTLRLAKIYRTWIIIAVVHILCWLVVFIHVAKPPREGNRLPTRCCTSQNFIKILGYAITLVLIFIAVAVKQRLGENLGTKIAALILCTGLIGMSIAIFVLSKLEENYYGRNLGFWWHANWLTIGMLLALSLKAWQYSTSRNLAYTHRAPLLTAVMFVTFVTMNLVFYYSSDLSWVDQKLWNVKQIFGNYPIGHLYVHGGGQFLLSMILWNALTIVEIIEGPFFVLFMLIITLNAS